MYMDRIRIAAPCYSHIRTPALLIWDKIEPLMAKSKLNITEWVGPPRKVWFKEQTGSLFLYLADCGVTDDLTTLCFDNGRHRTRCMPTLGELEPCLCLDLRV